MIRLAPVLLMMAAVVGGASAAPACLPDCNVENLIGHDLRFANMAGASLRGAALTLANAARADLSYWADVPQTMTNACPCRGRQR